MNVKKVFSKTPTVIDASVMIKLIVQEDDQDSELEAVICKLTEDIKNGRINILSTPLIAWEVGNWAGRCFPHQAMSIISLLGSFGMIEHRLDFEILYKTIELMKMYPNVSFYDASYHALALIKNGTFLTNDHKYYQEAHRAGHIKLLKDY